MESLAVQADRVVIYSQNGSLVKRLQSACEPWALLHHISDLEAPLPNWQEIIVVVVDAHTIAINAHKLPPHHIPLVIYQALTGAQKINAEEPLPQHAMITASEDTLHAVIGNWVSNLSFNAQLSPAALLIAGSLHNLSNSLSMVQATLRNMRNPASFNTELQRAQELLSRAAETTGRMFRFALTNAAADSHVDLCQPQNVLHGCMESLQAIKSAAQIIRVDGSAPSPLHVRIAAIDLFEVVTNIVKNALEAFGDAPGEVVLRHHVNGDLFALEISDNGPGIPEHLQRTIFNAGIGTHGPARGLGLAISRWLLRRAGGDLELLKTNEQGTSFSLTIPVVQLDRLDTAEGSVSANTLPTQRVAMMEDDPMVADLICDLLQELGQEVRHVDVQENIDSVLQQFKPSLFLVDLDLTTQSGWDILERIKAHSPQLTTVLVTGWPAQIALSHPNAKTLANHILHKPIRIEDLQKILGEL